MSLTESEFNALAGEGYNRIPLSHVALADLETPVSTYLKLARGRYSFLFESVTGGEKWGRYSIIGLPAKTVFYAHGNEISVEHDGDIIEREEVVDPLAAAEEFHSRFRVPEVQGLPRFTGGLVGYFGYDTVRYIEPQLGLCTKPDVVGAPDVLLMVADEVLVFDNLSGRLHIIVHVDPGLPDAWTRGQTRLAELSELLLNSSVNLGEHRERGSVSESDFVASYAEEDYKRGVQTCRDYIHDGDIFQVVLSSRLSVPFQAEPIDLYRALRTLNPSPYMYFLDIGDFQIVGSSPEILVRLEDNEVTVRPIAGTRPRGRTPEEDDANAADLMGDPKELAEHLMLVDLGRNDVGRVARIGTVKLTEKMIIERYSHVMHIVSNVTGQIRPELSAMDVLRATFPAGTVSGAPKVRAMQIIEELEPDKRGVYSGAVGYLGWHGNMDTAIAIRTAVIADGMLYMQAGAGLVADSVPENEWAECQNKARAVFRAVDMATRGLDRDVSEI